MQRAPTDGAPPAGTAPAQCYFSAELASPEPRRRLLLISYHFPPAPTAGALRWQKLSRHAAERGFGLDVIALDPECLPLRDPERLDDLPPGTHAFGVRQTRLVVDHLEHAAWRLARRIRSRDAGRAGAGGGGTPRPASIGRAEIPRWPRAVRDWRRAYYAWLEYTRDGRWARAARVLGQRLLDPRHRAVVSCGPPQMAHEAGRLLARAAGLPHVIDLRDPWSLVERLPELVASPVWLRLAEKLERRAVRDAALVVANTEVARDAMQGIYPERADDIVAVPNGCDEDPIPAVAPPERFTVAYLGSIYLDRDPTLLFRAAARLVGRLGLGPDQLAIEFMGEAGHVHGTPTDELAARMGLGAFFRRHPPQPREKALDFLARASILVSLAQDSHMAIPSKIFEYARFPAWVVVLAERGSATEVLLRGSGADRIAPRDEDGLFEALHEHYLQHVRGERPEPIGAQAGLSRRAQADRLFDALERRLVPPRADPSP